MMATFLLQSQNENRAADAYIAGVCGSCMIISRSRYRQFANSIPVILQLDTINFELDTICC